jgi:hypothetical protein
VKIIIAIAGKGLLFGGTRHPIDLLIGVFLLVVIHSVHVHGQNKSIR